MLIDKTHKYAVACEGNITVVLDLTLTPELIREGYAREFIHIIQEARKSANFNITDRITVDWESSDPEVKLALTEYADFIASEVLAFRIDYHENILGYMKSYMRITGAKKISTCIEDLNGKQVTYFIKKCGPQKNSP